MKVLRIGLLGLGQVGGGVYSILTDKKKYFAREIGIDFEIAKIAVRSLSKKRTLKVPKGLLTTDPMTVVNDPSIDVVVEVLGGTTTARHAVVQALRNGKHVVTANKALLAEYGDEIFGLARDRNCWIHFEASVGGGIPVIKALREGLVANRINSIYSIINGTTNYILTKMTEQGWDFDQALAEAQKKGYAEADPTFDIEGIDAAHKLAVLTRFAFGGKVRFKDIYHEGISSISSEDIAFAHEFGYRIKLLAIAKATPNGEVEARVQPTLLPENHILANVNGSFNAVLVNGDEVGDVLFYGRGAGSKPTASAVISDLVDVAMRQERYAIANEIPMRAIRPALKVKNISALESRYYLRFNVIDRPGVLAKMTTILGKHQISISDVIQKERSDGNIVPLILLTHGAQESDVRSAIRSINHLNVVKGKSQLIRIEGDGKK